MQDRGADIVAYDPVAVENMRPQFPDVTYADTPSDALDDAAAALIVTDWPEITALDEEFDAMATPVVIDGRRAIEPDDGLVYEGVTWYEAIRNSVDGGGAAPGRTFERLTDASLPRTGIEDRYSLDDDFDGIAGTRFGTADNSFN